MLFSAWTVEQWLNLPETHVVTANKTGIIHEQDKLYSYERNVVAICKGCETHTRSSANSHWSGLRSRKWYLGSVTLASDSTNDTGQRLLIREWSMVNVLFHLVTTSCLSFQTGTSICSCRHLSAWVATELWWKWPTILRTIAIILSMGGKESPELKQSWRQCPAHFTSSHPWSWLSKFTANP